MKRLTQQQEAIASRFIARSWVKESRAILERGLVPAKLTLCMEDISLFFGYMEEAGAIYFSSYVAGEIALTKAAAERIKKMAKEEAIFLLKDRPENASLLAHFSSRKPEPEQAQEPQEEQPEQPEKLFTFRNEVTYRIGLKWLVKVERLKSSSRWSATMNPTVYPTLTKEELASPANNPSGTGGIKEAYQKLILSK